MNKITGLFNKKSRHILSIYITAGFPEINSTVAVIKSLQEKGVDFIEVGFPFSDPLADGPVIQQTSQRAIKNGMNLELLLHQLEEAKQDISIPFVLMGYLNPVLQLGMKVFCRRAKEAGASGVILPDLPLEEYENEYKKIFADNDLHIIFLVTPETQQERIRRIDKLGSGFIYAVSASSTTGRQNSFSPEQVDYLKRLKEMDLVNPVMTGFGIHNSATLQTVFKHTSGAIIGTAYLKALMQTGNEKEAVNLLYSQLGID